MNCIAVNTENIVNASVANKLWPVKLNEENTWLPKRTQNYLNYEQQKLNEVLIQDQGLTCKRHRLLSIVCTLLTFSVSKVIMVIKVVCWYWCKSFGCTSNPHTLFFCCINNLKLLNFSVIPSMKFQLLCAMIMTRKLPTFWVKDRYNCLFAINSAYKKTTRHSFWICNCLW